MNHVKASLFDGFAMVGTANYDKFSMRVNQEINFCFWDKKTVEIEHPIKTTGNFDISIKLGHGIHAKLALIILGE